jgi:hypothetical protein
MNITRHSSAGLLLTGLLLGLSACDGKQAGGDIAALANGSAGTADAAAPVPAALDPEDPCRLLQPAEVEAVLGKPLAGAPFRSGNPLGSRAGVADPTGSACWYEAADFTNIAVQATWAHAGAVMAGVAETLDKAEGATRGHLRLQDGTELAGDWDEAKITGCCNFVALRGDSSVEIDVGGTTASFEQAAKLAEAALGRLEAPLPIDGAAGTAAAEQRRKARVAVDGFCGLWDAADIAAVLGPMQGEPELSDNTCTYRYRSARGGTGMFMSIAVLRNGARMYRNDNRTSANLAASLRAEHGQDVLAADQALKGPWDEAVDTPLQFNTRKGDTQIAIRHQNLSDYQLRELVTRAYVRLGLLSKEGA